MFQLEPGSEFAGFVVEGVIGTGGMSVLYRARDPQLQRVVALKIMSAALSEDDDFRRRFTEEARLAAAIDHPNVVPIYGFGQVGESLYIAMRYVPGTDLRKLLRAESALTPRRVSDLLGQVAAALDVVHRRGMVHRDVKPDNVLITPPAPPDQLEYAYLADFGLTRSDTQSRITQAGQIVGTLAYAAPEQLRGEEVSGAADVYSLGCVLYECLVGDRPFRRNNDASVIYAHLHDPPPRLTEVRPDLPAALDPVIETALAKDPADRFASAGDLLRAFRMAVGLEAGPVTSEISVEAIARAADAAIPPVEVWAVPTEEVTAHDTVVRGATTHAPHPHPHPTPTPTHAPHPTPTTATQRKRPRPVVLGLVGVVLLSVLVGALYLGTREPRDGIGPPGTEPDVAGFIGTPTKLSDQLDVQATRSMQFTSASRDRVTVQLKVINRTSAPVVVDLVEEPPASLVRSESQIVTRMVSVPTTNAIPASTSTPPTTIAGGGTTNPSNVSLPFHATIAAGGETIFEYTIKLESPGDGVAIRAWGAAFPTQLNAVVTTGDVPQTSVPPRLPTEPGSAPPPPG